MSVTTSFGWINTAPLIVIPKAQVATRLDMFRANMKGWDDVPEPYDPLPLGTTHKSGPDIDARDWKTPKRSQQERWNDRLRSTHSILKNSFNCDHVVEYRVAGLPIALMGLDHNDPLYIADLVCHPGSLDGGGIMMEYAVNYAVYINESHDPVVNLWALNDDAMQAYLALGFASDPDEAQDMTLDLRTNAPGTKTGIWQKTTQGWRLAKYVGTTRFRA